jgi:hypothetical protein
MVEPLKAASLQGPPWVQAGNPTRNPARQSLQQRLALHTLQRSIERRKIADFEAIDRAGEQPGSGLAGRRPPVLEKSGEFGVYLRFRKNSKTRFSSFCSSSSLPVCLAKAGKSFNEPGVGRQDAQESCRFPSRQCLLGTQDGQRAIQSLDVEIAIKFHGRLAS